MHPQTRMAWFIGLAFLLVATPLWAANERFRAPRNDAETALSKILWKADYDRGFLDYLFADPNRNPKHDGVYQALVSKKMRESVLAYEKALPKNVCDGKFRSGRMCGYDANPLTCRADVGHYLYATQEKTKAAAIIALISEEQIIPDDRVTYKLVKQGGAWKIDGVLCPNGPGFNYKKPEPESEPWPKRKT